MGHVLEKVLADVIARWFRLSGHDVRFQIGTDEHGIKIQQTAAKQGITPSEQVDKNVPLFEKLYSDLHVSADIFMRTSDHAVTWPNVDAIKHRPTVEELWKRLQAAGALEKRTYTGLYCTGCERFITAKDLVDGVCPDHNIPPQEVKEENWFFLLSREAEWLKKLLSTDYKIVPEYRSEETLALLERGLEDVSFSRPKSSLAWGIPVPGDEEQTMYVWCDALTNYVSGIDIFGVSEGHERSPKGEVEWWDDAQVTHVIGKDIARFHALIWPAMLRNAGVRTPDQLLIHGFVTSEGQKMSKSLGNVVDPVDVLTRFNGNPDPMRFFLCHEIPVGRDGDFSWKRLEEMYQSKLGNQLGNMLNRTLVLLKKDGGVVRIPAATEDLQRMTMLWSNYGANMDAYEIHAAIQSVTEAVSDMNGAFNNAAPWTIKDDADKRVETLGIFAESLRQVALMLLPFIPDTAYRISKQLSVPYAEDMLKKEFVISDQLKKWGGCPEWTQVGNPEILFAPLDK